MSRTFRLVASLLAAAIMTFSARAEGIVVDLERVIKAAERASESVVRIDVVSPRAIGSSEPGSAPKAYRASNGSGFVIDEAGRIATAAHLVRDAISIAVVTADGMVRRAALVGLDVASDVAVLAVDLVEGPLPPALEIAAAPPRRGEIVAAIGSPYGMDGALSFGIVGGLGRARRASSAAIFVQHDAAINPGSSGGPLIGADGIVFGMNLAIPDGQFEFAGIGFALDPSILRRIVMEITGHGRVNRGRIGATLRAIDPLLRAAAGPLESGAALVTHVEPGGAADLAGLRVGDLVLAVGGSEVGSLSDLLRRLDDARAGDELIFKVRSAESGDAQNVIITLAAEPPDPLIQRSALFESGLEIPDGAPARVGSVASGSPAEAVGLEPGDVVLSVGLTPVADGAAARLRIMGSGALVALMVRRADRSARLLVLGADPSEGGSLGGNSLGVFSALR